MINIKLKKKWERNEALVGMTQLQGCMTDDGLDQKHRHHWVWEIWG